MKRILFLSFVLFAIITATFAQNPTSIIPDALKKSVEIKVEQMQQLIGFDDNQAEQLKALEFQFLLDVRKAEKCRLCNTRKRIERLQIKRDAALQQILTRVQYIRWDAAENDRVQNIPVRL
ncbi:MAG: hypothetical protein LBI15_10105 [Dysgonamonadaceae bacterium]|jgi:uncharacterized Fe-S radical SAM superfamily protein PflX|nr:hypothetical protein [Dysgonamonadaceae bacterium]